MVTRTKKIFVGGLSVNTTVEDVKQYFEQFGKVGLNWGVLAGGSGQGEGGRARGMKALWNFGR